MTLIQKPVNNLVEPTIDLFDWIRDETLNEIAIYLKNMNIPFNNLLDFLENPAIYPGKIVGLKQIIERFLNVTISKYYKEIQAEGLPIKFVINMVRKNLFQGGWSVKKYQNITMATRGRADAQKAVSTSRIDEPSRLISIKNKVPKAKSKPKPKSKSKPKKRAPKIKAFKLHKEVVRGSCDYCGVYIKIRYTSNFIHVNIHQNPKNHYFCSKECKINWIFAPLEKKRGNRN